MKLYKIAVLFVFTISFVGCDSGSREGFTQKNVPIGYDGIIETDDITKSNTYEDLVIEVQEKLRDKGYAVGKSFGILDAQTVTSLEDFQEKHGLEGTGRLDEETVRALGLEAEKWNEVWEANYSE